MYASAGAVYVRSHGLYVYLLASRRSGSLYIGMTNDLIRRVHEHKQGLVAGFTQKYKIRILVYVEVFDSAYDAIAREKQLKTWNRAWKIALTQAENPYWNDLYRQFV
ncbi:GIY-YIG nuclease family protein [Herbaspirillum sp. WKF16]|uniref:GIY-YIG nuclease family protein n=1 Tax=Herbaspirillum sp. WKF16 TaxID=3028312 RepID=UPI0023A93131|nr:GIY-YIG nuclease family protein [Herbaspirillum sp. WKF16]WDZ96541.1 GIY-YIG nuclease family protein [Herbaspirillum sp. WKF16]